MKTKRFLHETLRKNLKREKTYHKFLHLFVSLVLALAFFTAAPTPQLARAAGPWYVATTGDDNNDCLSPLTPCATIQLAIERATAGDAINVAIGTYTGTGNEVVLLYKDITLSGGWDEAFVTKSGKSTIDGQGVRRGISVSSVVTVEDFIIQNGFLFNSGGGIFNGGTLTLNSSTVTGNSTDFGGGIWNIGTLMMNYSTVSGNSATTFGGGILNGGVMTLNYSTVKDNSGAVGGIANSGGALTLNNSTVSGNSSTGNGGGILNAGGPTGTVTLNNTTVSGNLAIDNGGGVANFSGTGAVTLNYSTVTNNTSDSDNDWNGYGGGVFINNSNGLVNLQSSIVAGNKTGLSGTNDMTADCFSNGALVSQGYNLTGNGTGCDPLGGAGDMTITPASVFTDVLGMLANNGGATKTHALIVSDILTNPALNVITIGTNSCGTSPFDLDQRNIIRPQDSACDIGAFELIPPIPPFPTTPILDDFNRLDGPLGSKWLGYKSAYRILGNQVDVRGNGPIYWKNTFGVDQEVAVTLTNVDPTGKEQDLLLKVQGQYGPNWGEGVIEVLYNARTNNVVIWTFRPDTLKWFKYPPIPVTFVNGDLFGAQALATGDVVIFKNGMEAGRVTLNAADQAFFNPRGGYIGLWFIDARNAFFDDFGGGDVTMP